MPLARQIRNSIGNMVQTRSRLARVAFVLVLTFAVLMNSLIQVNNTLQSAKRRLLCADYKTHRGTYRRHLSDADCATIWPFPEGTGELVPWTSNYPPKKHDANYATVEPTAKVAYVVHYKSCPEDLVAGNETDGSSTGAPTDGFPDNVAVLQHSTSCTVPTTTSTTPDDGSSTNPDSGTGSGSISVETPTMYALMHPDAVACKGSDGQLYDRATILQGLGYWVKIWEFPVDEAILANQPYIAANIDNDVGLNDLMKVLGYKLADRDFVVIMDQNYILKKALDPVFDELRESGDIAAFTRDPNTGGPADDILILKPNLATLDTLLETFATVPYTPDGGWGDSGIGLYPGGMGTNGLIDYIMNKDLPTPNPGLDRCTYANNADDICNTKPFEDIVGYTMDNVCGKPWMCSYGELSATWSTETKIMCETFLIDWIKSREDFESTWTGDVAERTGEEHLEIYRGLCTQEGPDGYIPLIAETVPAQENCVGDSNIFYGCDYLATSETKTLISDRSQIEVTVNSPQQCEIFTAGPNNGGAVIPFSGVAQILGTGVADTSMVFVIDRSGSTCDIMNLGCSSDENYDMQYDDILDCEIAAILDLVSKVREEGSVSKIGLVSFSHTFQDIVAATIELPLTDIAVPGNTEFHAIENAIRQLNCGGATNYAAAVEKACEVMETSTSENNVVVFISDGEPTRGGAPASYCTNNAVFHTIALGPSSTCDGGDDTSLTAISQATEGTCQEVPTIKDIRLVLQEIGEVKVDSITGSTVASESSVNFGCMDIPNFTNSLNLGCDYFTAPNCGGFLSGGFANSLGETGDSACCACGGGMYSQSDELERNENVEEVDPDFQANKKHSLAVVAYSDTAIMHPGTHMVCTTTIGAEGGVHGQNQQCKKILVCPHPTDY